MLHNVAKTLHATSINMLKLAPKYLQRASLECAFGFKLKGFEMIPLSMLFALFLYALLPRHRTKVRKHMIKMLEKKRLDHRLLLFLLTLLC